MAPPALSSGSCKRTHLRALVRSLCSGASAPTMAEARPARSTPADLRLCWPYPLRFSVLGRRIRDLANRDSNIVIVGITLEELTSTRNLVPGNWLEPDESRPYVKVSTVRPETCPRRSSFSASSACSSGEVFT